MKRKTSVYLNEEHLRKLRWAAEAEGRSQSEVVRDAILQYQTQAGEAHREFALFAAYEGPGTSVEDIPEEELLRGFGRESLG